MMIQTSILAPLRVIFAFLTDLILLKSYEKSEKKFNNIFAQSISVPFSGDYIRAFPGKATKLSEMIIF